MAPDIRRYAEMRQSNAVISTASPIVVRTTPTLNARKYESRNLAFQYGHILTAQISIFP